MGIGKYIKEIGRGKDGARALTREQSADLFGQVLDQCVTDLEIGAFCLAMRIKGETAHEMAGFLDATEGRLCKVPTAGEPAVVLPSYNGARKLPVLTPLLAGYFDTRAGPKLEAASYGEIALSIGVGAQPARAERGHQLAHNVAAPRRADG